VSRCGRPACAGGGALRGASGGTPDGPAPLSAAVLASALSGRTRFPMGQLGAGARVVLSAGVADAELLPTGLEARLVCALLRRPHREGV